MVRTIVPLHQILQDGYKVQRVLHREVTIQTLFQGTVEPFHHTGFAITAGRKMMNVFSFHQILKRLIVKLLPVIRLKVDRFPSPCLQNLVEGFRHSFTRLVLHGLNSGVLGKNIHHRQQVSIPSIALGNIDHVDQIPRPLLVDPKYYHWSGGKPSSSRSVQRVPQISFQDFSGTFDCDLIGFGKSSQTSQTAWFERIMVPCQQRTRRNRFSLLHNIQSLYTQYLHRS